MGPQQQKWITEVLHNPGQSSVFVKSLIELLKMILNENCRAMNHSEAEKYREELMSEGVMSMEENARAYFGAVSPQVIRRYSDHFQSTKSN